MHVCLYIYIYYVGLYPHLVILEAIEGGELFTEGASRRLQHAIYMYLYASMYSHLSLSRCMYVYTYVCLCPHLIVLYAI